MFYKKPKDNDKYQWTNHAAEKMAYYRLSESLVKRVVRFPKRVEVGIAPGTTACMQSAGSKKRPSEVWVMWKAMQNDHAKSKDWGILSVPKKKIITAWRYPGISPVGERLPIPDDILVEIEKDCKSF